MKSILELITALRRGEIETSVYLSELETLLTLCRQRQKGLSKIDIAPQDQTAWNSLIRPGLSSAYRCVVSAAEEAKAYQPTRDPKILQGIYSLLNSAERINLVLEGSMKMLSGWTQDQIAHELSARIQVYHQTGQASTALNFIEPGDTSD